MRLQKQSVLTTMALALAFVLASGPAAALETQGAALAALSERGDQMTWTPSGTAARLALSVSGPEIQFSQRVDGGAAASFSLFDKEGNARPDGVYKWELREEAAPVNNRVRDRKNGRDLATHNRDQASEFSGRLQYGVFTIKNGGVVDSSLVEPPADRPTTD